MGKKFLLISQVFYPDQVSTANLYTDLCSVLAGDGIDVEVWAAQPSYTNFKRQSSEIMYRGLKIKYLPSTNFPKTNIIGRLCNTLTFTFSVIVKVLVSKEKTPVWTHTTPPVLGIIIALLCTITKRKFFYILLDIFPEGLVRLGKISDKNLFIRYWNSLFIKTLKRSEKIIVIGRDTKKLIKDVCPECEYKTEYIPIWQDDSLIFPLPFSENSFIRKNNLESKFVVQYSGNFGLWTEVKTMGRAANRNIENVVFIFVGDGIRKSELLNEFSHPESKSIIFMPFQTNETFNSILTASSVQIVTLKAGLEGIAVPSKIYGILAAGLPVIAMVPSKSELAYIVEEEKCGFILDPEDLDGLINTILILKSDEILRKKMGENSRRAFEKKYTTKIIARQYIRILNDANASNDKVL